MVDPGFYYIGNRTAGDVTVDTKMRDLMNFGRDGATSTCRTLDGPHRKARDRGSRFGRSILRMYIEPS